MGLSQEQLHGALRALADEHEPVARVIADVGLPPPRISARGFATLARTIIGQQVSVASAAAVWNRLDAAAGGADDATRVAALSDEELRAAGLSRQKSGYLRSLADEVTSGRLDLSALPADDEEAIAHLVRVKGIGRWSAEIYLLFAEGRTDIWPAGDLAVQIEVGRILGLDARPSEADTRALAEAWRPHRGAVAILAWHSYGQGRIKAPV
ncbi:DNA-3-methyladenine glycosylase II [Sphingomonas jejuensis]|uniref:DNA-3-methyladenine glycosylase II n=1 Tax=Sphingomonas jejuensis TaxID=904715 RepID=A0ABX0XKK0_9SPHN|nr:DNA-3-methyladenine glycosylase 2 family protein [Sphingomonas jejuensis]NJC33698.1 DNA-3-methyladenine glycosylase II [Sphingomonas jejuensis]